MSDKAGEYSSRKQITFDLKQEALSKNYPRPKFALSPTFYKKAYKDIGHFMSENGFEHRQYSVYVSKEPLSTYDIANLMDKLANKMPWLYPCVNEIDVTDIGEQHSIKEILGEFTQQKDVALTKAEKGTEEKPTSEEKGNSMSGWKNEINKEKSDNPIMKQSSDKSRTEKGKTDR